MSVGAADCYHYHLSLSVGGFKTKKEELVVTSTVVLLMLILTSSAMYYVENTHQPEVFKDIPSTMWWSVATLTTVDYGDVYPITGMGKLLGAFVAIHGVGLFTLPTAILGSGFMEAIELRNKKPKRYALIVAK
jgi:voltage-gated potassium channel